MYSRFRPCWNGYSELAGGKFRFSDIIKREGYSFGSNPAYSATDSYRADTAIRFGKSYQGSAV